MPDTNPLERPLARWFARQARDLQGFFLISTMVSIPQTKSIAIASAAWIVFFLLFVSPITQAATARVCPTLTTTLPTDCTRARRESFRA